MRERERERGRERESVCVYVCMCVLRCGAWVSVCVGRHEDEVLAARRENVFAVVSNADADDGVCA